MAGDRGLAAHALHEIAEVFQVKDDRSERCQDGFDWWPGDFRVSVRAQTDWKQQNPDAWRLLVKTECLKDVPVREHHFKQLAPTVSRYMAPTYAWAYAPEDALRREPEAKRKLWFVSCAYLDERNASWIPTFLAEMSIMQPINAQIQAEFLTDLLKGGAPDVSRPERLAHDANHHALLSIAELFYVPCGQEENRWIGTGEFPEFAEKYARNDDCFGTGSETGLTLETPFGSDSALIRLGTYEKHPALGNGLLATIHTPFFGEPDEMASECAWLNFFESVTWTNVPMFGCWYPFAYEPNGQEGLAFASFIPNALYRWGLATNVALWMVARARWLRQTRWPNVADKTMMEIFKERGGFPLS